MNQIEKLCEEIWNENLIQIVCSNTKRKEIAEKVKFRPILLRNQLVFQESITRGPKVFHENFQASEASKRFMEWMKEHFHQAQIETIHFSATVLVGKKGNVTIKRKEKKEITTQNVMDHNRKKQYILPEGQPIDFLVELGIMNAQGIIRKEKYDKYKQINRYLEFIADIVEELPHDRCVRIVDFGCGKSYLTFAVYYYLKVLNGYEVDIIGLDLKEDVIQKCSKLADKLGYGGLRFEREDISHFSSSDNIDMVVTLHACDIATDYAIEKAVKWNARVILCVPCCQHEVNAQIASKELKPILKYGIIKERMSALFTDAIRANVLEEVGYDAQILEFIDMEHTPKNLLIRAVKKEGMRKKKSTSIARCCEQFQVETTLQKLLKKELENWNSM